MVYRLLLISCLILLEVVRLAAQAVGTYYQFGLQLKTPFTVQQFSTKDGLPQSEIFRILPLSDRSLLISTGITPVRFDGYAIKRFLNEDEAFYHNLLTVGAENTVFGISQRDGQLQEVYPSSQRIESSFAPFYTFLASGDSILLLDLKAKLFSYNPSTQQFRQLIAPDTSLNENYFFNPFSFCKLDKGVFLARYDGVFQYDLVSKSFSKISENAYALLAVDPFTKRLLGLRGNRIVSILEQETLLHLLPLDTKGLEPKSICFRKKGEFILGTTKGLCFISQQGIKVHDRQSGLPSESCQTLYFDEAENTLFVGTNEKGVLKLKFKSTNSFASREGCGTIGSVIKKSSGEVLFINNGSEIRQLLAEASADYISTRFVFASLSEIRGLLFAGTWGGGLKIYKDKLLIDSIKGDKLHSQTVISCIETRDGNIWIGSKGGLSFGKTISSIKKSETIKLRGRVLCMKELSDGTLAVGTTQSAYFIRNNAVVFSLDNYCGEKGFEFRCFYEDAKGRIWMGTYGHGILVKDGNNIASLSERKNCLLHNDAFCLVPDGQGYLYSSSNQGLWRIHEKSLFDFYEGRLDYIIPLFYGEEEGILNTEFNGGFQNNFLKTSDNHFYFPGIEDW